MTFSQPQLFADTPLERERALRVLPRMRKFRTRQGPGHSEKAAIVGDPAIREALHRRVLATHQSDPNTVVIDELSICHGYARVDVAVVNGELHGYEIKSQLDSVSRLAHQACVYSATLDRVTLVTHEKHLSHAINMIPNWWGIMLVQYGQNGEIQFQLIKESELNPKIDPISLVEFLWKGEALSALKFAGKADGLDGCRKQQIYERIVECFSVSELKLLIRHSLKRRHALPVGGLPA